MVERRKRNPKLMYSPPSLRNKIFSIPSEALGSLRYLLKCRFS